MDYRINKIYEYILKIDCKIVICCGGRSSGKSYFVGGQYIFERMLEDEYFRAVAVRKHRCIFSWWNMEWNILIVWMVKNKQV